MASRLLMCVVTAAAVLGIATPAAVAQQDSPTVDPGSPSGKEYALPLQAARQNGGGGDDATPGTKSGAGSDEAAPLFGVGVGDDTVTTATATRPTKRHAAPERPATRPTTTARTTPSTTTPAAPTQTTAVISAAADGGDGGDGTLAVIVVGVLAAGLLAGAALRWQAGRTTG